MTSSFDNQKVVVAGGSSRIGLATAQLLTSYRAQLTVTGRDAKKLETAKQTTSVLETVVVDTTNREVLDTFFRVYGQADHLVIVVSGRKGAGDFRTLALQDLREAFEAKFSSHLSTLQAALPFMRTSGSITLITAASATAKLPGTSGLGALNGALEIMVPILAKELKSLRIHTVSPGVVDTTWWDFLPATVKQQTFEQYAT